MSFPEKKRQWQRGQQIHVTHAKLTHQLDGVIVYLLIIKLLLIKVIFIITLFLSLGGQHLGNFDVYYITPRRNE